MQIMRYEEDDYLMLSGIQHYGFCPRQWAMIHLENQWVDNALTMVGNIIHEKAHDDSFLEKRSSILITRGLRVASHQLGLSGQCDVVEFTKCRDEEIGAIIYGHDGKWKVCPIEYKKGKPKEKNYDALQLCAEVMCLEEMLSVDIPYGYLFYHDIRRRLKVDCTASLRQDVKQIAVAMHETYERGRTPKVKPTRNCQTCSLKEICLPKLLKKQSVENYFQEMLGEKL